MNRWNIVTNETSHADTYTFDAPQGGHIYYVDAYGYDECAGAVLPGSRRRSTRLWMSRKLSLPSTTKKLQ